MPYSDPPRARSSASSARRRPPTSPAVISTTTAATAPMPTAATVTMGPIAVRRVAYPVRISSRSVVKVALEPANARIRTSPGPPSSEAIDELSPASREAVRAEASGANRQNISGSPVVASSTGAASGGSSTAAVQ